MAITPKRPLFDRSTQYGWYDYGNFEQHPANIWFVGSCVTGCTDAFGWGMNPDSPFATLDYAVGQCTNSVGDVIYVLPGHTETVAAAGGLTLDIIGITIIGIGDGTYQPVVTLTDAASDVLVNAASITVEGIHFMAGVADVLAAIDIDATDFTLRRCRFTGDGTFNAIIWIQDAAAAASDRITIEDCLFADNAANNTHAINFAGTGTQHIVRRNQFIGHWSTWAIGGAGAIIAATICDNYVYQIHASADSGINLAAATTGVCMNNRACTGQASASQITAPGLGKCQNYGGIIGDSNGLLEPIAT